VKDYLKGAGFVGHFDLLSTEDGRGERHGANKKENLRKGRKGCDKDR